MSTRRYTYKRPTTKKATAKKTYKPRATSSARVSSYKPRYTKTTYKPRAKSGGLAASIGSAIGAALGGAVGGPGGAGLGGALGRAGGGMLSNIFGHGDYAVTNIPAIKENSIALSNSAQIPQFGTGKVAVNFKHREFLGDVISSATAGAFKIDSFPINPGLPVTFPWLSGVVGAKFQQYRCNGMSFEFRSMSADALNSTNTALGCVVMSTDYDSADVVFASKQEMENTEYGVSCKPSVNMMHAIECARIQTPVSELYIRAWDVPSGKDVRLYDLGRFSIATVGCQGTNVNLGELWVSYDIDVFKAIEQVPAYLTAFAGYALNSASATAPLGTSQDLFLDAPDQIGLTFASENKVTFPLTTEVGATYLVNYSLVGSEAKALTGPAFTTGGGMYIGTDYAFFTPNTAATSSTGQGVWVVRYKGGGTPAAPPYINFADFTWAPASISAAALIITQVSGLFPGAYTAVSDPSPRGDTSLMSPEYIAVCDNYEQKKPHVEVQAAMYRKR